MKGKSIEDGMERRKEIIAKRINEITTKLDKIIKLANGRRYKLTDDEKEKIINYLENQFENFKNALMEQDESREIFCF